MCIGGGKGAVFPNDCTGLTCDFPVRGDTSAFNVNPRDIVRERLRQNTPISQVNVSNDSQAHHIFAQLLTFMLILLLSNLAIAKGGGGGHSSGNASANNRSNQLNPNNDAYWQSRGYEEHPNDVSAESNGLPVTENGGDADNVNNRSNQLNPNNDAYWQSRGYEERPNDVSTESNESPATESDSEDDD